MPTALGQKVESTAHAARWLAQSLSALGVLQRKTEATVSLVYRNDDGVDASTQPPISYPDQQKRGQVFCPGFFPHFVADRPEYSHRQGVPCYGDLLGPIIVPDAACRPHHSPGTSDLACRDRVVVRFPCRVTTALRSGSDAAHRSGGSPISISRTKSGLSS